MAVEYVRGLCLKVDTAQLLPFFEMLNCYGITSKQTLERTAHGCIQNKYEASIQACPGTLCAIV